jgi:hypothetical protein
MKKMIKTINMTFLSVVILLVSCTNLDEEIFGSLSPENYYQTEEEALSSLVGVFSSLVDPS